MQTLGLYQGESVRVFAKGEHAEVAVEEIAALLQTLS
ncbi:MAG: HPr family phosphocarrier protein [Shewanella sp.]